jgi:thiosulfate dehydrogenase [quinone] large subunit
MEKAAKSPSTGEFNFCRTKTFFSDQTDLCLVSLIRARPTYSLFLKKSWRDFDVMKWLSENRYAAILLTLVRLYIGWKWLAGGWGKLAADKAFDASGFLQGAITKPVIDAATKEMVYPYYVAFLKHFALPNVELFNHIVPWGEFLVGVGLILGCLTTSAAFFGLLMNFMYLLAGSVSMNPWMILFGFIIVAAGSNAGKFGIDRVAIPHLRSFFAPRTLKTTES